MRRSQQSDPESLRQELISLLENFEEELKREDLREKVLALVPVSHLISDLGSSLIPADVASSARDRILYYFLQYPQTVIAGDELRIVAGINEWPRRIRELRREYGWSVLSGSTVREMNDEGEFSLSLSNPSQLKTDDYILLSTDQDREAAYRWRVANGIRRKKNLSVQNRILEFLRENIGLPVTGDELQYVAGDGRTEWARRVRELRTEQGWPIVTRNNGRPELPVGVYVLEEDRQSPAHDRSIPDQIRTQVLRRDDYRCQRCRWSHDLWNRSDPRHLELHHIHHHADGGDNTANNLITLCTMCHDTWHATVNADFIDWLDAGG